MKLSMILMGIAALFMVGTVNAAVTQGQMDVDLLGGYAGFSGGDAELDLPDVTAAGADISAFFLMGRYGYFVTPNIQVSAVAMGALIDAGDLDDISVYAAGVAGKFHFMPDQQGVPYVGAQALYGVADIGESANAVIYGAVAGYRYSMTPTTDFFVEGQYNFMSGDLGDVIESMYGVFLGFTHKWK